MEDQKADKIISETEIIQSFQKDISDSTKEKGKTYKIEDPELKGFRKDESEFPVDAHVIFIDDPHESNK